LSTKTSEVQKESISLLAGDFPSIQSYIFDGITKSKNLAKRLRARSFIVQILNEAVIEFLLDKLKLPRANILINAG
jgi:CRISPR-associated protein Csm1